MLFVSGFVAVYLLGIGPAARLDAKGITPPWVFVRVYWPLVSVAQSSFGQSAGLGIFGVACLVKRSHKQTDTD